MMLVLFLGVVVLSLYIAFKFDGLFHKIIALGAIASILSVLIVRDHTMITISFFMFFLMQIATLIYGITNQQISLPDRICIITMGLLFSVKSIGTTFHYPFANEVTLSLFIPILLFIYAIAYNRNMRKELSFMIFWAFYAGFDIYNMMQRNLHQHHCG